MARPFRLFVLAGEASGDRIGADLVHRLKQRTPLELIGVGGPELVSEGLSPLYPMADLSVMGWSDVVMRLPLLLWRARQTAQAILASDADAVVLIDSQVFSATVARRVRRRASNLPMLLYVAPSVWAWRPERAGELRPLFDEVLAVLPFEPRVMRELGGPPTHYVGHPAVRGSAMRDRQPERGPLLLLPGSREGELRRHLVLMREAVEALRGHPRVTGFVVPTLPHLVQRLEAETANWPVRASIVTGSARGAALGSAVAALAVSGTITLELALAGVPMVVTYVGDRGQARRFTSAPNLPHVGLPNIIAGSGIVPELLFAGAAEAGRVGPSLARLLDRPDAVAAQLEAFRTIRAAMEKGAPEAPLEDPATRVLACAAQRRSIGS
ncbi:lipid-A-disaccharide synthase [Devosia sp.]|uniref:lipid-A-disaccharide synthase n=1 Tax=Devosia sp. TaxID=1871048 RepID=UPI0035B47DBD